MVYFVKNLIYLGCIVVIFVIGLSVWTTWHIPLSQLLISRQIVFLILFVVVAAVVLVLANTLLIKWGLVMRSGGKSTYDKVIYCTY